MSKMIKEYHDRLVKNSLAEKVFLAKDEYENLQDKNGVYWDIGTYKHYKIKPFIMDDSEMKNILIMKNIDLLEKIEKKEDLLIGLDRKVGIIKNLAIFWTLISSASAIGSIYMAIKFGSYLSGLKSLF